MKNNKIKLHGLPKSKEAESQQIGLQEINLTVEKDFNDSRIDVFLSEKIKEHTRSYFKNLINNGKVKVNDLDIKPNYKLKENDNIAIFIEKIDEEIKPQNLKLDVIYDDEYLAVINKPRGMVVHPAVGHTENTLVNALLYKYGKNLSYINEDKNRPGIVHRLDKDTSGVLVIAKSDFIHEELKKQFANRETTKKYNCIVFGKVKEENGIINEPIGRHEKDRLKRCVNYKNGKEAITEYRVLKHFKNFTLLEVSLITGRTHQIRVHFSHLNFPVVGDALYTKRKPPFNVDGQILHGKVLGFTHPVTSEKMLFETDLPDYFLEVLRKIEMTEG